MDDQNKIDISALESLVDNDFLSIDHPHVLRDIAVWHVLTVSEDQLRMLFAGWADINLEEQMPYLDESKYALRHCLKVIFEQSGKEKVSLPQKVSSEVYNKARIHLNAGVQFERLSRIFTTMYNKRASFVKEANAVRVVYDSMFDGRYGALEGLGQGRGPAIDITGLLHHWLTTPALSASLSEQMISYSNARVKNGRVVYDYHPAIVNKLANQIPQRERIIPEDFQLPWGNENETQALINALHIRCLYHSLIVNYVAVERKVVGGADSSLVLVTDRDQLCEDLDYLANFSKSKIERFIDFLTYGNETDTPDPALQPLIPTLKGSLLVPCIHILTSHTQRNILALMARIHKKDFDQQSNLFEATMVESLSKFSEVWPLTTFNKVYKIQGKAEEIDILVIDEAERTLLALELRWMVPPGDSREVHNRIKVCTQKVKQLERKVSFVSQNIHKVLARVCPDLAKKNIDSEWDVRGIVVLQGFGGSPSPNPEVPVVTIDVLSEGLNHFDSLIGLYNWVNSLSWLPEENRHFSLEVEELIVGDTVVQRPCILPLQTQTSYFEDLIRNAITASELSSVEASA